MITPSLTATTISRAAGAGDGDGDGDGATGVVWVPDGVITVLVALAAGSWVEADAQAPSTSVSDARTAQATAAGERQRTMPR